MKTCFKCSLVKPLGEFYRHPQMADGHLNKCKECTRSDDRNYRKKNPEKIAEYERRRWQDPVRRAAAAQFSREHRERNPEKYKARTAVGNAVRDGRLKRRPCEHCGTTQNLNGHHEDYMRKLDVNWLCRTCHFRLHGEAL